MAIDRPRTVCWGELFWARYDDGRSSLGGAPATVAIHLAALGMPAAVASRVGRDDLGNEAIAELSRRGVAVDLVQRDGELPTARLEVEMVADEPFYELPASRADHAADQPGELEDAIAAAGAICWGTLGQHLAGDRRGRFEETLAAAPGLKVFDPNLREPWRDTRLLHRCLEIADVVKLNELEAATLEATFHVHDAVAWLLEVLGCELVALTRGGRGARLVNAHGDHSDHRGYRAGRGGDHAGAGDAYVAALIALSHLGADLQRINEGANRLGAYVASHRGATPEIDPDVVAAVIAG